MTVTLKYLAPYTSAPTAAQQRSSPRNLVIATVLAGAAGDALQIITHNFGLAAAEITLGYPVVTLTPEDGNAITSPWFEISENPNYTVLGKGTTAAGALTKVAISRPPTQVR